MTKLARVIVFFISIFFLLSAAKSSFAEYLIQPIPKSNNLTIEQSYNSPPSITFGDLLSSSNPSGQPFGASPQSLYASSQSDLSAKAVVIRELLAQLETSTQESRNVLAEFNQRTSINNQQLTINNSPSPTPYIPIPTLIAGVSEIVSNQNSVLGIQQSSNQSTISNQQLPISNPQSITDIGNLNQNPVKTTYTIAVLGDSMVDTLGRDLYHLKTLLSGVYPSYAFALLNYGQGATDLSSGLYRLTNTTMYLGETFAPLLSFRPDILVVESFAYNHWSAQFYDLDRQWLAIAKIIDTVRENSPDTKIVLAATIAPNSDIFGDGSLNWPESLKWESAQIIKAYLQNLVNFATSQNYPLADAYHPSLGADGKGIRKYINGGDNLHPSGDGGWLFAQKIVEAIKENNLITQLSNNPITQ